MSDNAYIGADKATNNTAELSALKHALEYIISDESGRPVMLRYDSTYAAAVMTRKWRAKSNKALAANVQDAWRRAYEHAGGRIWLKHVKGHSKHKWNDRADQLARQGRRKEGG